ncbi:MULTISPECIES: DUF6530 family protein [Psychrobacter]|uniref:DUF6530 family protein n=1 Tax=Psychrobacter TaxID=497 RepID=UPI0015992D38|nr:DUF6530 family protein [Psychrobacter sp.]QJS05346.1 hypothetical protein [Psychrobacter sp.]
MKIPNHLKHQPIIKLEKYAKIDGNYNESTTDAQGLSLGLAQWGNSDLSVKVWRHTGTKWSRQSEELPLHRVVDLTSLICGALYFTKHGKLPDVSLDLSISDNQSLQAALKNTLNEDFVKDNLDIPFKRLSKMLKELGY